MVNESANTKRNETRQRALRDLKERNNKRRGEDKWENDPDLRQAVDDIYRAIGLAENHYFSEYMDAVHKLDEAQAEIDRLHAAANYESREPVFDVDSDREDFA